MESRAIVANLYNALGQEVCEADIERVLHECNGDEQSALDELFSLRFLRIAQLQDMFPRIPASEIQATLGQHKYNLDASVSLLLEKEATKKPSYAAILQTGKSQAARRTENKPPQVVLQFNSSETLVENNDLDPVFQYHRGLIDSYRQELPEASAGRTKELHQLIAQEQIHAANAVVEMNKSKIKLQNPVDFHRLVVREALHALRQCLRYAEQCNVRKIGVICGSGNHGPCAVLLPTIKSVLVRRKIRFVDDMSGVLWIYLLQ